LSQEKKEEKPLENVAVTTPLEIEEPKVEKMESETEYEDVN